ncbi:MAG: ATP-dependent Clp protease adaptor ClpS [Bacteroidota bacterium]
MRMTASNPSYNPQEEVETLLDKGWTIVVYNDDVNTFDWVIANLIKYCGHTKLQAEQCAWIIHNNGKYAVKSGSYEDMEPICTALCEKGLSAELEVQ